MKFDWQQLSPCERDALLRHFLLKRKKDVTVTAEKICAALKQTHYLAFNTDNDGKAIFRFVRTHKGAQSGASVADNLNEGIFKAALRAKGVKLEDGFAETIPTRSRPVRLVAH
jgi:hypothetical protein